MQEREIYAERAASLFFAGIGVIAFAIWLLLYFVSGGDIGAFLELTEATR